MRTEEQSVEARDERGIGRGIVHRGRDDKTVSFFEPGSDLIHPVIENAFPRIGAAPARDASAYRLIADLYDFSLNALCLECLHKLIAGYGGIASYRRTSVEYQHLHYLFSPEARVQPAAFLSLYKASSASDIADWNSSIPPL